MAASVRIRLASETDAPALLEIYAPYVQNTAISFETEVPSVEQFQSRIHCTLSRYPYFIAEEAGRILGYTYASPFKNRAAYDWAVETSIYVRRGEHSRGIGRALYNALETALLRQNVTNLNACIAYPHPQSVEFHRKMGYREVGVFHRCGFKLGQWRDMLWMEKMLCEHPAQPQPFVPFAQLTK